MNQEARERNRTIIRFSLAGAGMNLVLAVMKIIAGTVSNAHAITLDGINSLSDMATFLISILSAFLAGRRESRNHPFGYGRLEYLGSILVSLVVIYFGFTAGLEAADALLHPHEPPSYSAVTIAVMAVSLAAKLVYGVLMKSRGKRIRSGALVMSAVDSLGDALISAGILAAIAVQRLTGMDIESYICLAISLMIVRTGVRMIIECGRKMIGTRPDPALRKQLVDLLAREKDVLNITDIVLHNYGEGNNVGSAGVEVDAKMTAGEISILSRRIIRKARELGVTLTSVGVCGTNFRDPETADAWDRIIGFAGAYSSIRRLNSFVLDPESREISFSVIQDYNLNHQIRNAEFELFEKQVEDAFPGMRVEVRRGIDI